MAEHRRPHWSNWHITYNANKHEQTDEQRRITAETLTDAVDMVCTTPTLLWSWLKHFKNGERVQFSERAKRYVQRVRARVSLEEGPLANNRSVHCHILLEVQHVTRVQIDSMALKEALESVTGWRGTNIMIRFVKGDGEDKEYLLRYLQKDGVPQRRAQDPDNARIQNSIEIL